MKPRLSTPGKLIVCMVGIAALALVAAAASLWTVDRVHDAAQTIGRDAEPSVALALRMEATLGDLDAIAFSDSLTDGGASIGSSFGFRAGLDRLAAELTAAAQNITYGDAEAIPIRNLARMLLRYEEAVVEARELDPGNLWLTERRLQWASRVNRDFAVPEAAALAAANADQLEQRYASYRATSLIYAGAAFVAFAALVLTLVAVQLWLAGRTRRLINPLLAAATFVAAAGGLWFGAAALGGRADLGVAKSDAYDSLHVLFDAKSEANALRAAASLWLLSPAARPEAQTRMDRAAHVLIGTDLARPDQSKPLLDALAQALTYDRAGNASRARAAAPHPGGLLGQELDNITFGAPEREAATESVAELEYVETVIRGVQALEQRRDHTGAVVFWLDPNPRGGTGAFALLQAALDRTIAVNQAEFDRRVASALRTVFLMPFVAVASLALATLLAVGGLWLRLREYR